MKAWINISYSAILLRYTRYRAILLRYTRYRACRQQEIKRTTIHIVIRINERLSGEESERQFGMHNTKCSGLEGMQKCEVQNI